MQKCTIKKYNSIDFIFNGVNSISIAIDRVATLSSDASIKHSEIVEIIQKHNEFIRDFLAIAEKLSQVSSKLSKKLNC